MSRRIKNFIIIMTILFDIYIMGIVDLFKPPIYALIFVLANYMVYYFCFKKDRMS